jgi:hypothetical protein
MEGVIESNDLPIDEKIYLKKSFGEWKVVHPIKNDDGTINWFNFLIGGSWFNFILLIISLIILTGLFFEYTSNLEFCNTIIQESINSKYVILIK